MTTARIAFISDTDEPWREIAVTINARGRQSSQILVVPGVEVLARWMTVAGATPAQMRAAALVALAPDLAQSADACVASIGECTGDSRLVCIASRSSINRWLAAARQQGFAPDLIIPDFVFLPPPAENSAVVAARGTDIAARTETAVFGCQRDLIDTFLPGQILDQRDFDTEAVHAIRQGRHLSAPDFAHAIPGRLAPGEKPLPLKRITAVAGIALVLGAAAPWVHAIRLDNAAENFRREAESIARDALPGASRIVNARAQLEEALVPARRGGRLTIAASAIIEGASSSPGVSLSRIEADTESTLSATLSILSPDDLAPIRARLAAAGLDAIETMSAPMAGRIPVDLVVRVQR